MRSTVIASTTSSVARSLPANDLMVERFGDLGACRVDLVPVGQLKVLDRPVRPPRQALARLLARRDTLGRRPDIEKIGHAGRGVLAYRVVGEFLGGGELARALDD